MQAVAGPEDIQRSHSTRHGSPIRQTCAVSGIHQHGSYPEAIRHRINAAYLDSNKLNNFKYIQTYINNTKQVCVNKGNNCKNKLDSSFSIQTTLGLFNTFLFKNYKNVSCT